MKLTKTFLMSCNRLENAVKPQLFDVPENAVQSCNRLENAVKPQRLCHLGNSGRRCNRLENAVKPQLKTRGKYQL